jgi:hypothetical protein
MAHSKGGSPSDLSVKAGSPIGQDFSSRFLYDAFTADSRQVTHGFQQRPLKPMWTFQRIGR